MKDSLIVILIITLLCFMKVHSGENEICATGEELCFRTCYSPESGAKCFYDDTLCQAGEDICGNDCYDAKSGAKCYNGVTLCKDGEDNCGEECYVPAIEKCFNNKKVCRIGREPCRPDNCYWIHNETCFEGRHGYVAQACPNNLKSCGYECYDTSEKLCLEYRSGSMRIEQLCSLGSGICGGKCYELSDDIKCVDGLVCQKGEIVCGKKCYTPTDDNKCIDGVVCLKNQTSCGNTCYIPADDVTCDKGVVCKTGEAACAGKCYNPTTVSPHFKCATRKDKQRTAGTVVEEYMDCDEGYDRNVNGDCQRTIHMAVDSDEDTDDDEVRNTGSSMTLIKINIILLFPALRFCLLSDMFR